MRVQFSSVDRGEEVLLRSVKQKISDKLMRRSTTRENFCYSLIVLLVLIASAPVKCICLVIHVEMVVGVVKRGGRGMITAQ